MNVIGLMSGTSADGVDAALVDVQPRADRLAIHLLAFETFPYPPGLRPRILALASGGSTDEVCHLNVYLGELFADAAIGPDAAEATRPPARCQTTRPPRRAG